MIGKLEFGLNFISFCLVSIGWLESIANLLVETTNPKMDHWLVFVCERIATSRCAKYSVLRHRQDSESRDFWRSAVVLKFASRPIAHVVKIETTPDEFQWQ